MESPTPVTDSQWSEQLISAQEVERARIESDERITIERLRYEREQEAERRKTVRGVLIALAMLLSIFGCSGAILLTDPESDPEKEKLSRICIEAGGTWEDRGMDGHTCRR